MKERQTTLLGEPEKEQMKCGGIYMLSNNVNDFVYIGGTVRFSSRLAGHIHDSKRAKSNHKILEFLREHSWSNIEFHILEVVEDMETLREREDFWIAKYDINDMWNVAPKGSENKGVVMPEGFGENQSERMMGNTYLKGHVYPKERGENLAKYWKDNAEALEIMKQKNRESQKKVDRSEWKKGKIIQVFFEGDLVDTVYGLKVAVKEYPIGHVAGSNMLQGKRGELRRYFLKAIGTYHSTKETHIERFFDGRVVKKELIKK